MHNNEVMNSLPYDDDFIKMFCSPEESGTKNPDYILFGASINHLFFDGWLERFEEFIKKLNAFSAIVFVESESCGDRAFAVGYELNGKFNKDIIEFGDPIQYMDNEDDDFPLFYRILKYRVIMSKVRL